MFCERRHGYRGFMRTISLIAIALAACGHNNGNGKTDGGGDGNGDGTSGSTTITLTLTDHPSNASMFSFVVAYQDGAGAWTLAPPPSGDTYTFTVNSAAYGVAWTCVNSTLNSREVDVLYFAVAERTSITAVVPPRCTDFAFPANVGLSGTITNATQNTTYHVAFGLRGPANDPKTGAAQTSVAYAMETPPSTHDLIAGNDTAGGVAATTDVLIGSAFVERGLAINAATVGHTIDFSTAVAAASAAVTNVPTGTTTRSVVSTDLVSKNGTAFTFVRQTATGTTFLPTRGLSSGQADPADVYLQQIRVDDSRTGSSAITQNWVTTIAAQAYTAPTAFGGTIASVAAATPYPQIKTTWSAYTGTIGYAWTAAQPATNQACAGVANCITWTVGVSPGTSGSSPQVQMPDFSALTGWDTKLQFATGTAVNGSVAAIVSSVGPTDFPDLATPPAGTTRAIVGSGWTVTP